MPTAKQTTKKKQAKSTRVLELPQNTPEMQGQPPEDGHSMDGEPGDDGRVINEGTSEESHEINEQKDNSIPEVPTVQANFTTSMIKFGVKPPSAKAITDYIVATGSPLVFEDPLELLTKMTKFPFQVPALIRRQVLDYWIAINKIELPEDYEKQVNKMDKTDKDGGSPDDEAQVQFVGGKIVPTDKPMSPAQAQKVRAVVDAMGGDGKGSDEAKFTMDENGELIILPGAKLSVVDAMLFGTIKQRRAAGDNRDPLEILADSVGKVESVKTALGIQGGGGSVADEAIKWKTAFGSDEATKALIDKVNDNFTKSQDNIVKLIEKISEKPKEDPQVAEMKAQLSALNEKLDSEREERHKLETESLKKQISDLSADIKAIASGKQATDAYGIMSKGLDKASEAGKQLVDKVGELMTRGNVPAVVTSNQKKNITSALGAEAEKTVAAQRAGAKIFAQAATPPAATAPPTPQYPASPPV